MATKSLTVNRVGASSLMVNRVVNLLPLIALILFLIIMLFPFVIITMTSLKTEAEYYARGPLSLPQAPSLNILIDMWKRTDFTNKLINSTIISLGTALLATGLSLLNAFALGIGKVRGKAFILLFFLVAITLPGEALAYPLYYAFKAVKLYDTLLSVILVSAALHTAYGTYLLSSVFTAFPRELLEAAIIDGCNKVQLLFRLVVPLNMPSISVLFVFFFIWTWNDFFLPLILLISNSRQTVPVAMALARGEQNTVVTAQSAAALLGILPCIIFFLLFQRTLTKGITAGSFK